MLEYAGIICLGKAVALANVEVVVVVLLVMESESMHISENHKHSCGATSEQLWSAEREKTLSLDTKPCSDPPTKQQILRCQTQQQITASIHAPPT